VLISFVLKTKGLGAEHPAAILQLFSKKYTILDIVGLNFVSKLAE